MSLDSSNVCMLLQNNSTHFTWPIRFLVTIAIYKYLIFGNGKMHIGGMGQFFKHRAIEKEMNINALINERDDLNSRHSAREVLLAPGPTTMPPIALSQAPSFEVKKISNCT